ncbi:MAG: symporter small accessory protein [Planifilum fulgidum]
MLGMDDGMVALAWLGTVLSAAFCVLYGLMRWKQGGNSE